MSVELHRLLRMTALICSTVQFSPRHMLYGGCSESSSLVISQLTAGSVPDLTSLTNWLVGGTFVFHRRESRMRSEEHTSELQSRQYLVCRLLLEKKKKRH